ncbi:phage holin family protein [Chlamydiifrater phoenicopteri]|uniref:phage holin family protein n=1 Tax=Chlamydiifrater phoenicopteri TaxID=2681469 RepID=UPI001BCC0356|nr:phage holin family protein [Chlamydiifrater phoenicopteri]
MSLPKELDSQRLCWKCEGSVSVHVAQCPYCSAFLQDPPVPGSAFSSCHLSPEQSQEGGPEGAPGLFAVSSSDWDSVLSSEKRCPLEEQAVQASFDDKLIDWREFLPFVLISSGLGMVMFSVLLFLFSKDGVVTLSWNKSAMMYCFLVGAPALYKGYKMLSAEKDCFR